MVSLQTLRDIENGAIDCRVIPRHLRHRMLHPNYKQQPRSSLNQFTAALHLPNTGGTRIREFHSNLRC